MKKVAITILITLLFSCQKEIQFSHLPSPVEVRVFTAASTQVVDQELSPPLLLQKIPSESGFPEELIQYILIQQSLNNIPSSSYSYQIRRPSPVGGSTYNAPKITVDFENQQSNLPLNVIDFLKCFSKIPDTYATCKVEIFCDIPVDDDPTAYFDWSVGFPGHTFLQLTKTNGVQTIVRTIGFYPNSGLKAIIADNFVPGKFVDNGKHEFNAALSMPVSPAQMTTLIDAIIAKSKIAQYDIDDYNCTDFALSMFNKLRLTDPLIIPKIQYFGGSKPMNTPQALYRELLRRRGLKPPNPAVRAVKTKLYASPSSGSCN